MTSWTTRCIQGGESQGALGQCGPRQGATGLLHVCQGFGEDCCAPPEDQLPAVCFVNDPDPSFLCMPVYEHVYVRACCACRCSGAPMSPTLTPTDASTSPTGTRSSRWLRTRVRWRSIGHQGRLPFWCCRRPSLSIPLRSISVGGMSLQALLHSAQCGHLARETNSPNPPLRSWRPPPPSHSPTMLRSVAPGLDFLFGFSYDLNTACGRDLNSTCVAPRSQPHCPLVEAIISSSPRINTTFVPSWSTPPPVPAQSHHQHQHHHYHHACRYVWNHSAALSMVQYIYDAGQAIWGAELGNEINNRGPGGTSVILTASWRPVDGSFSSSAAAAASWSNCSLPASPSGCSGVRPA
jgi:hypothetical protein